MTVKLKVLLLVFHGFAEHNGISKKIMGQIDGLSQAGASVDLCSYEVLTDGNRGWFINKQPLVLFGNSMWSKIQRRFDYRALAAYIANQKYNLIYVRSDHNANPFTIMLFDRIKRLQIKMVMEIPTYPYDGEYKGLRNRFELFVDKLFRKRLSALFDGIVTFANVEEIFGQRTLQISNGIDLSSIKLRATKNDNDDSELHLLAVAEIHFWHGIDRVIRGLAQYKSSSNGPKVVFHVVGAFAELEAQYATQKMIQELGLQDQVILHGACWGENLDFHFDQADFAIGSLARHRSGITAIKTLKNREYAARGISFIYSEQDTDFDIMPYIMKAPADDSPLDISRIVDFHRNHSFLPQQIRQSIVHLSWFRQMSALLEQLDLR